MTPSPTDIVAAHQYLYYVVGVPVWPDDTYDAYCDLHGIEGNGGSDCASSYDARIVTLAKAIQANPLAYPPRGKPRRRKSSVST